MSGQRDVIDLDEGGREPAEAANVVPDGHPSGRRRNVRLVAALLAGVVLGGVGVGALRDAREARQRDSAVSLVAFPASGSGGGSDVAGVLQMDALLAVVNAGPAPVTLRAVTGRGPGVVLRDTGQSRLVRPGGVGWIEVKLRLECASAFGSEPLPVRFSVETADRRTREVTYPVAMKGSLWQQGAEVPCEHLR
ncbi:MULTISPECIES: hypothetical protein [unclassified Micromonospora]|uniref:hypothetical protein n=1 Tax=unclassified Micromonospora TaxID=2617518 RepID=UPI00098CFD44|nr:MULTISPECIES: hypothetical protein [unclassified Micromonospora]MDI5938197.1 hypothetical protein [Micromonospora sp. DH15]OON29258.1 hypothetical protein BSA16_22345 [Micromonospora sp. Rc5]